MRMPIARQHCTFPPGILDDFLLAMMELCYCLLKISTFWKFEIDDREQAVCHDWQKGQIWDLNSPIDDESKPAKVFALLSEGAHIDDSSKTL